LRSPRPRRTENAEHADPRLAWVRDGYVVAFGGFLAMSGRLSDLIGPQRVFFAHRCTRSRAGVRSGYEGRGVGDERERKHGGAGQLA
jgi:hypothetical protein